MPERHHAGMDFTMPIRVHRWWPVAVLLAGLLMVALLPATLPMGRTDMRPESELRLNTVVHWRGAGIDWLLVIDHEDDELIIYDAGDGRPLCRLGEGTGSSDHGPLSPCSRRVLEVGRKGFRPASSRQQMAASKP